MAINSMVLDKLEKALLEFESQSINLKKKREALLSGRRKVYPEIDKE